MAAKLETFFGKYVGFGPTDESNCGMGEMEMTIDAEKIKIRMATGLEIQEDELNISEFDVVEPETILAEFQSKTNSGEEVKIDNIVGGLRHKNRYPEIIFLRDMESGDFGAMMMTGGMGDMMGPTILHGPAMVEKGHQEEFIKKIEEVYGSNTFPRLANGGRVREEPA